MLQWYIYRRIRCNWGGKWPMGVSQVLCHLETKLQVQRL